LSGDYSRLCKQLDYQFKSIELLKQALTHRSAGKTNNERLEFLGDAVLGMVIGRELFHRFPELHEGDLSRIRATLVRRETLAEIARTLQLRDYLILGQGELKSGGHNRDSILANCVEGIIGAAHEDGGFESANVLILSLYKTFLSQPDLSVAKKDPKSRLQEHLQSRQKNLPVYTILESSGEPHDQYFKVQCHIEECELQTEGEGNSRRHAEQQAAKQALAQLKVV
jgi:ribonuclease III